MSEVGVNGSILDELDEDGRNAVFDRLQAQLPEVWKAMRRDDPRESVVVVPSMTLDRVVEGSGGLSQALEERFLFFLLLLRQPRLRMVYVTSQPINPPSWTTTSRCCRASSPGTCDPGSPSSRSTTRAPSP